MQLADSSPLLKKLKQNKNEETITKQNKNKLNPETHKHTLLIYELKPALNVNVGSEKLLLY